MKGRKLAPAKGVDIRPTTDQAREALFNILIHRLDLEECRVLDLFSGSGAVSFEFVSRGSKAVLSLEQNARAVSAISERIKEFRIDNMQVIRADAFKYISRPAGSFDIVFADPPFAEPRLPQLPSLVMNSSLLTNEGLFILEHGKDHDFSQDATFLESRKYGHVFMSFFQLPTRDV